MGWDLDSGGRGGVVLQVFRQAVSIEISCRIPFASLLIHPDFDLIILYIFGVDAVCVSDYSVPPDFKSWIPSYMPARSEQADGRSTAPWTV